MEIEFESPAHDIVGFESMPKTEKQRAAVEAAVAALKKGEALFRLTPGAGCKLEEAEVETPLAESDHKEEQKHAEEEEHSEFPRRVPFPLRAARPVEGRGGAAVRFVPYDAGDRDQRYPSGRPARGEPETGREPLRFLTPLPGPAPPA